MAEELSMAATEAWNLYALGLQAEAIGNIASIVLALVLAIVGGKRTWRCLSKKAEKSDSFFDEGDAVFFTAVLTTVAGFVSLMVAGYISKQIITVAVPEYRMIGDLAQFAGEAVR